MISTPPSLRHRFYLAGLAFLLVLTVGYGSDVILVRHTDWMIADDLILALAAAVVLFLYETERSRSLSDKLRVVREMNAFVRNELQILYTCLEQPEQLRVSTIERSVGHIDWALRELLPGREAHRNRSTATDPRPPGTTSRAPLDFPNDLD